MEERRFPRDLGSLESMSRFVATHLERRGLDPEHSYAVDLIIEELFTNMLKYGKGGGPEVSVALGGQGSELVIRLEDFDVESFDVTGVPAVDPSTPLAQRRAGGLGVHLVRRLSDTLRYEYRDRNAIITVTKRLERD